MQPSRDFDVISAAQKKKKIRKQIKRHLQGMFAKSIDKKSQSIARHIFSWEKMTDVRRLALYKSKDKEVHTDSICQRARNARISCFMPKIIGADLHFGKIRWDNPVVEGPFGISEPMFGKSISDFDMIVLPCLAVDASGKRLGRGKGFF